MPLQASILVVDDDPATRTLLGHILAAHGYLVIEAAHGRQALERLDGVTPDAILLDLAMPVMDGFEFLRLHRAHPQRGAIPVIVLSGVPPQDQRCVEMPSVRFVAKPFTEGQVIAAIHAECGHLTA